MSDYDEISASIGALSANSKSIHRTVNEIHKEIKGLNHAVTTHTSEITHTKERLDDIEPIVTQHEKIKDKTVGAALILSVFMTGIGYFGHVIIKAVF